jgi:UDP-glucose 4-epimerase
MPVFAAWSIRMDTILLTGKTGLFSKDVLEYIGYETQVFLTGQKTGGRLQGLPDTIRMFPVTPSDNDFRKVFELGEIRAVWHVSGCADGGRVTDESANIERIAKLCSYYSIPRLIVITESADKSDFPGLIRKWSSPSDGSSQVRVAVVQTPFLTGSGLAGGRLDRIFTAMRRDETVCLEGGRDREICVLAMQELSALLMRMSTENWFQPGIYEAGGSRGTQEELRETLLSIRPGARIEYPGSSGSLRHGTLHMLLPATDSNVCDGKLEEIYRLPVSTDWTREIAEQYSALAEESGEASPLRERLTGFMQKSGKIAGTVLDLAIMFLLAEYLARITSESVYFKIVDVRLIFVILMGMMHGIAAGFAAAILECVMLVMRYNEIGISGLLLFYNVENWIPFVYYLTAGAISGYSHQKREQQTRSVMKENELIRNKYLFLNEAYRTSVSNRKDLWTQILSEEDSYGKIYGAVRQMKQRTPEAVCVEAVRVLRRLLDNGTVLIYQLDPGSKKALLLSCCRDTGGRQAIDMAECAEMFRTVQSGETWKNIHFSEYAPMYAARVKYNRMLGRNYTGTQEITYLVTVEKAGRDQLSLWYMNHFTILCGLFQDALESAALRERTLS